MIRSHGGRPVSTKRRARSRRLWRERDPEMSAEDRLFVALRKYDRRRCVLTRGRYRRLMGRLYAIGWDPGRDDSPSHSTLTP